MNPTLEALVDLQRLDSAAEAARRRIAELPGAERDIDLRIAAATTAVQTALDALAGNQQARRALERDVSQVDTRLARFDDHKASVKTNQEYTALLHEIATARQEKDGLEERILLLLDEADRLAADVHAAETAEREAVSQGAEARRGLTTERQQLEAELARLAEARRADAARVDAAVLARYDQLLKQRRMVAVAAMVGETCTACHVRLRPSIAQQIRRNDAIVECDSCHRILYYVPRPAPAA